MLAAMSVIACNPEKETPVLEIPNPSYDVAAAGGEVTVSVKSNTDWTVSCKSDADWYNSDVISGNGDQDIVITVNANESEDGRSADFEVSTASGLARTFTVSQAGYSTPAEAVNLSAEGTANCYIVAPGSVAYFKANVKGNGTEALEGGQTRMAVGEGTRQEHETSREERQHTRGGIGNTGQCRSGSDKRSRRDHLELASVGCRL